MKGSPLTGTVAMPLNGSTVFALIRVWNSKWNCAVKVSDLALHWRRSRKRYLGRSVIFTQHAGTLKARSDGMVLARDLKTQPKSKAEAENEERL